MKGKGLRWFAAMLLAVLLLLSSLSTAFADNYQITFNGNAYRRFTTSQYLEKEDNERWVYALLQVTKLSFSSSPSYNYAVIYLVGEDGSQACTEKYAQKGPVYTDLYVSLDYIGDQYLKARVFHPYYYSTNNTASSKMHVEGSVHGIVGNWD